MWKYIRKIITAPPASCHFRSTQPQKQQNTSNATADKVRRGCGLIIKISSATSKVTLGAQTPALHLPGALGDFHMRTWAQPSLRVVSGVSDKALLDLSHDGQSQKLCLLGAGNGNNVTQTVINLNAQIQTVLPQQQEWRLFSGITTWVFDFCSFSLVPSDMTALYSP